MIKHLWPVDDCANTNKIPTQKLFAEQGPLGVESL